MTAEESQAEIERLRAENAALKLKNKFGRQVAPEIADDIQWRIDAGLTPDQAVEAAEAQLAQNFNLAKRLKKPAVQ
jgi:hypothetical protein